MSQEQVAVAARNDKSAIASNMDPIIHASCACDDTKPWCCDALDRVTREYQADYAADGGSGEYDENDEYDVDGGSEVYNENDEYDVDGGSGETTSTASSGSPSPKADEKTSTASSDAPSPKADEKNSTATSGPPSTSSTPSPNADEKNSTASSGSPLTGEKVGNLVSDVLDMVSSSSPLLTSFGILMTLVTAAA